MLFLALQFFPDLQLANKGHIINWSGDQCWPMICTCMTGDMWNMTGDMWHVVCLQHWCYYPHMSRDSVSPVCGIFILWICGWMKQKLSLKVVLWCNTFTTWPRRFASYLTLLAVPLCVFTVPAPWPVQLISCNICVLVPLPLSETSGQSNLTVSNLRGLVRYSVHLTDTVLETFLHHL